MIGLIPDREHENDAGTFSPSLRFDPSYDMIKAEKMILQITIELKTE